MLCLQSRYIILSIILLPTTYIECFLVNSTPSNKLTTVSIKSLKDPNNIPSSKSFIVEHFKKANFNVTMGLKKERMRTVPRISNIIGPNAYEDFVEEDDRLCVVLFTAAWCKNCQTFKMKYKNKLVRNEGDLMDPDSGEIMHSGKTRFAVVDFAGNEDLCQKQGISKVPFIRIYKRNRLMTEFDCGPSSFPQVVANVKAFQKA